MPNYKYKCTSCGHIEVMFLKISTSPGKHFDCTNCESKETMTRRISKPAGHQGLKVWAGDWFKKTYGHDMGEAAAKKASVLDEHRKEVRELRKDYGINLKEKAEHKKKDN